MAKHALARRSTPAPKARTHSRLRRVGAVAGKRIKKHAQKHAFANAGALVGVGACAALGYAERAGKVPSLGGYEPSLVGAIVLGLAVPMLTKGKVATVAAQAGAALGGVAAYKLGAGAPVRVGYDDQVGAESIVGEAVEGDEE